MERASDENGEEENGQKEKEDEEECAEDYENDAASPSGAIKGARRFRLKSFILLKRVCSLVLLSSLQK